MTLKEQINKIKENWLLFGIVLLVLGVFLLGGNTSLGNYAKGFDGYSIALASESSESIGYAFESSRRIASPSFGDFAPDVTERKITKSANLRTEVERGKFRDAETRLKAIIQATDSFILSENLRKFGKDLRQRGNYQLKVEDKKYAAVISQLKDLGEVLSFSENANDITGSYVSLTAQLDSEQARLQRYEQMFEDSNRIEDKIMLTDRIFNQERTIKYLQNSLKNTDRRVEYSTISVTLEEKQSDYLGLAVVKFSDLIRELVSSFNRVIRLFFWAIPYAFVAALIWFVVRLVKKK